MVDETDTLPGVYEYAEDVSTQEPPPVLPARTYPATCSSSQAVRSKNNPDNILLNLEFTIEPSAFPADYPETDPVKLYWNRNVLNADTARGRFQLRRLCEKMRVLASRRLDVNDFVGKRVVLKVKGDSWQGVPRSVIDTIEAAD